MTLSVKMEFFVFYIKRFVAYRKYFDNFLNRNSDISKIYTSLLRTKIIFHVIGNKKETLT